MSALPKAQRVSSPRLTPHNARGVLKAFRQLVSGGFHRPHVSPGIGRSGRFRSTESSLVLCIEFFLFLQFDGSPRTIGVLFGGPCIHIFPGPYVLLGKRNTGE